MEYWLQEAKKLPYGGKRKIVCCGKDASMIINHTDKGYTGYCFRCSPSDGAKFEPHGQLSLDQVMARRKKRAELEQSPAVYLPKDFTTEIPDKGRVWLLKGGVSSVLATGYGIGWSDYYQRVIIPINENGELTGFIARSLDEAPKYIVRLRRPDYDYFKSDDKFRLRTDEAQDLSSRLDVILVEDALSAIRVGRVVPSVSVLGTSLSEKQGLRIANEYSSKDGPDAMVWSGMQENVIRIGVWMDPDKAGSKGAKRIIRKLRSSGYNCTPILSGDDPKRLSDREIQGAINASL